MGRITSAFNHFTLETIEESSVKFDTTWFLDIVHSFSSVQSLLVDCFRRDPTQLVSSSSMV